MTVLPGRHELNPPPLPDDRYLIINKPLSQPYRFVDLVEGGSFPFLVQHGDHAILVGGASYVPGGYYGVRADVALLFAPWYEDQRRQDDWYISTIGEVQPKLVIPGHWDNFFAPVTNHQDFLSRRRTKPGATSSGGLRLTEGSSELCRATKASCCLARMGWANNHKHIQATFSPQTPFDTPFRATQQFW